MKGKKSVVSLIMHLFGISLAVRTDFMVDHCGGVIDLAQEPAGNLELRLTSRQRYATYSNCFVTMVAPSGMRIHLVFLAMDINSFHHCPGDYLEVYDGLQNVTDNSFLFTDQGGLKFCGNSIPRPLTSQHSNLTLRFVSDASFHGKGFSLLLTSYHEGQCSDDEYRCSNSRCFHRSLRCDGYNHCGDDSCSYDSFYIVGSVLSAVILLVAVIFLGIVLRYRYSKDVREDSYDYYVDDVLPPLDQMSDVVEAPPPGLLDPVVDRTLPSISVITRDFAYQPCYSNSSVNP